MAHPYFSQLKELVSGIPFGDCDIVCKHFFSGAAMYANGRMVALLSPQGLAFRLSEARCEDLLAKSVAQPLCHRKKSSSKRQYLLFEDGCDLSAHERAAYFQECVSTSIKETASCME